MKLKRVLATVLSAAMVLSCLAGCGSSTADTSAGSTSSSASTDSASTDSASADSGEVQEITWMFWDDLNATEDLISIGYKETIDRFNKDYEGKYHVTPITTNLEEYYTKLNAYLADGWKDTFTSDAVFAGGTYSDGIYAIPLNIAAACVFYNTEMFEKAGAEVPKTFDELLTSCQKLQDAGYTPITISAGTAWCLSMVAGYLCDRNGLVLSDIADHKTDWKDEKVINAGKQIQELSKYFQATAAGDSNDQATAAFYNGEAAMLVQGSWAIGQINGSCAEGFADKVGVFAFPAVTGGNPDANRVIAKSDSLCMSASTKYPEAAIALMKYFTDDTAQKYTAEVGGKIPVTSVEYDENVAPPELAYVMDVFKNASSTFGFYNESLADTEAGSTFDNCFVEIFKGEDPETALQPIQDYYEMNVW